MTHPFLKTLTDTVSSQAVDINNRLRKDQPDKTPYTLGVASAKLMTDALTKGDTIGGFMRPYRKFRNVGTADKGATVASGMTATITDPLGGSGVFEIGAIRLKTLTAPTNLLSLTTITLKSNGTTIWSQTSAFNVLPAVGKIADLLSLSTALPSDIVLPATLTLSSTSGTFDATIDGIIVPPAT